MENFKRLKVLGEGTYGTVFLATSDAPNAKPLAIKSTSPKLSSYLQKEETILKSLTGCPEILQCYGIQITKEEDNVFYNLLLEYAPHGTLNDLIEKQPLKESQAKVYTRMILKGLSYIHEKGLVHCDLKPQNILLFPPKTQDSNKENTFYQVKIADFGLSKTKEEIIDSKYWTERYRGTPHYMSPESVLFGQIEAALDIWSLGCILIKMLTGVSVWREVPYEDLMSILCRKYMSPKIPDEISSVCRDFLIKCFRPNPRRRWTANKLLNHPFLIRIHDPF